MPKFQETHPRPDTVTKKPLTAADLMFLSELQKILNTQDTMGNADPRFWVIAQTEERPCPESCADRTVVVDEDGDTVAHDLKSFAEWLDANNAEGVAGCTYFNKSVKIKFEDGHSDGAFSLEDAVELVKENGEPGLEIAYVQDEHKVVQDTLFLTHQDCEAHLETYGYNYKPDAHAYAMTAIRSPRFERLLKIIQETDWGAFEATAVKGSPA